MTCAIRVVYPTPRDSASCLRASRVAGDRRTGLATLGPPGAGLGSRSGWACWMWGTRSVWSRANTGSVMAASAGRVVLAELWCGVGLGMEGVVTVMDVVGWGVGDGGEPAC